MRRWRRRAWLAFVIACLPAAFAYDVLMLAAHLLQFPRSASRAAAGLCVVLSCAVAGEGFLGVLAELGSAFPSDTAVPPTAARGHAGPAAAAAAATPAEAVQRIANETQYQFKHTDISGIANMSQYQFKYTDILHFGIVRIPCHILQLLCSTCHAFQLLIRSACHVFQLLLRGTCHVFQLLHDTSLSTFHILFMNRSASESPSDADHALVVHVHLMRSAGSAMQAIAQCTVVTVAAIAILVTECAGMAQAWPACTAFFLAMAMATAVIG